MPVTKEVEQALATLPKPLKLKTTKQPQLASHHLPCRHPKQNQQECVRITWTPRPINTSALPRSLQAKPLAWKIPTRGTVGPPTPLWLPLQPKRVLGIHALEILRHGYPWGVIFTMPFGVRQSQREEGESRVGSCDLR